MLKRKLGIGMKINLIVLGFILFLSAVIGVIAYRELTHGIKSFAIEKAKGDLGLAYRYIDKSFPGEWEIIDGKLFKGLESMEENYQIVDSIAEETGDTVTIFRNDISIASNVMIDGERAVGTKVTKDIAKVVLTDGNNFHGEAQILDHTYQTAYMPISDSSGNVIGIFYVGASQSLIDETISSFFIVFSISLGIIIIISTIVVIAFTNRLKKRLRTISDALNQAGNGDFTAVVVDNTGDELGDLSYSFNTMKENLKVMIQKVVGTSEQVAASSEELTAGAEQTNKATAHITEAIQEVASSADTQTESVEASANALEEVTFGIHRIAENASVIAEAGGQTREQAELGRVNVEYTVKQINAIHASVNGTGEVLKRLDNRSQQIGHITEVISGIANQTNLLALNAAIEAARAGENGKGFAVVADEVRKLAEQSQESSTQIYQLVNEIQQDMVQSNDAMKQVKVDVQEGLGIVEKSQVSFKEILQAMEKMSDQVTEMAATAQQISASSQEVSATFAGISTISKESSAHTQTVAASAEEQLASMEEISSSASSLSELAMELQETVNKFKM